MRARSFTEMVHRSTAVVRGQNWNFWGATTVVLILGIAT